MIRVGYKIKGIVQGVGFRPFIYRLALKNNCKGFVCNDTQGVSVEIEGTKQDIDLFEKALHKELPTLARIDSLQKKELPFKNDADFEILQSKNADTKTSLVSPDIATCPECLEDLQKKEKYKNYFATNCTNCGPRYSIVKTVPYDRKNTSMDLFAMCPSCKEEYTDPLNRRYHAQPISCNECGPKLDGSIEEFAGYIKEGKVVAIKGVGGFHIMCDATNDKVVERLRKEKNRVAKPFALMCKDLQMVESIAFIDPLEKKLLQSKEAPIVLLDKKKETKISSLVAPEIQRVGCMLAYTPLHHMLFWHLEGAVVATSANLADEPILTTKEQVLKKLPFIEHILDYNREIINGVDDSLVQVAGGKVQTLRLGRGYAPKVIPLKKKCEKKLLAVGANAKSTIALVLEESIILSPHIGDLDSIEAFSYFERTVQTFKNFYDFTPELLVHDKHPNYRTTIWAKQQNKELLELGHHKAHILACKAEFGLEGEYLGFSFDGTGYGEEGMLWGGEVFVGEKHTYQFRPLKLLGGAKAIKEPRRIALSLLFERYSLQEIQELRLACVEEFSQAELKLLYQAYTKDLNAPRSSSVGRLFDAVASFAVLSQQLSYEGQSGLLIESLYTKEIDECLSYEITKGVIAIDLLDLCAMKDPKRYCSMFLNTLVSIMNEIAKKEKMEVILSGGVFQNKTLLDLVVKSFEGEGITLYHQQYTPINDGGIALGQAYALMDS